MTDIEQDERMLRPVRDGRCEDMFLAWVLQLPPDADIVEEARIEIARLDALQTDVETTAGLRGLLMQASSYRLAMPRGRSRSRH